MNIYVCISSPIFKPVSQLFTITNLTQCNTLSPVRLSEGWQAVQLQHNSAQETTHLTSLETATIRNRNKKQVVASTGRERRCCDLLAENGNCSPGESTRALPQKPVGNKVPVGPDIPTSGYRLESTAAGTERYRLARVHSQKAAGAQVHTDGRTHRQSVGCPHQKVVPPWTGRESCQALHHGGTLRTWRWVK